MGEIADRWGEALVKLKEAYRLPPLEAFSLGLQVETLAVMERLCEDVGRSSGFSGTVSVSSPDNGVPASDNVLKPSNRRRNTKTQVEKQPAKAASRDRKKTE